MFRLSNNKIRKWIQWPMVRRADGRLSVRVVPSSSNNVVLNRHPNAVAAIKSVYVIRHRNIFSFFKCWSRTIADRARSHTSRPIRSDLRTLCRLAYAKQRRTKTTKAFHRVEYFASFFLFRFSSFEFKSTTTITMTPNVRNDEATANRDLQKQKSFRSCFKR